MTVLACFLGGVDPFGGFGRVAPVFVSLLILQTLSSGLNLLGANQHLSTAVWGLFLIAVMVFRFAAPALRALFVCQKVTPCSFSAGTGRRAFGGAKTGRRHCDREQL